MNRIKNKYYLSIPKYEGEIFLASSHYSHYNSISHKQCEDALKVVMMTIEGEELLEVTVGISMQGATNTRAFIDTYNSYWLEKFLRENGIAKATEIIGHKGFREYPLYEFDLKKLN